MAALSGKVLNELGAAVGGRLVRLYRRDIGTIIGAGASSAGDANFASVGALLPMNGEQGTTTFYDYSASPKTVTARNGAAVTFAKTRWGAGAALFGGGSSNIIVASSADLGFGAGDYTVEGWLNKDVLGGDRCVYDNRTSGGAGIAIYASVTSTGADKLNVFNNASLIAQSTNTIGLNTWVHFAVTRQGSTVRLFLNGNLEGSGTDSRTYLTTAAAVFGASDVQAQGFAGVLADCRVTKGLARYTASFTAPAAPLPVDADLGDYKFLTPYTGECDVVCLDDAAGTTFNDLILRATPA